MKARSADRIFNERGLAAGLQASADSFRTARSERQHRLDVMMPSHLHGGDARFAERIRLSATHGDFVSPTMSGANVSGRGAESVSRGEKTFTILPDWLVSAGVQEYLRSFSEDLIDWFHVIMRLTVLQQQTKALEEKRPKTGAEICSGAFSRCKEGCRQLQRVRDVHTQQPRVHSELRRAQTVRESTISEVVSRRSSSRCIGRCAGPYRLQTRSKVFKDELDEVFRRLVPEIQTLITSAGTRTKGGLTRLLALSFSGNSSNVIDTSSHPA